ncbi:MAG: hypothetical protein ACJ763_18585 [Bdellovibrionia bacterium]
MKITWAILATLAVTSVSTQVRADDEFPLVITEGLHLKHKDFAESVSKVGERFNDQEAKMFYSVERKCAEAQIAKLKSMGSALNVAQITIYLKNDRESKSGKYAEVKTVKDCYLGSLLCGRDKKILEVGGIVAFESGMPAGCSVVETSAIQQAMHKSDVYVSDNDKSISNRRGEKSRAPAGYFSSGSVNGNEAGGSSAKSGSAQ